MPHLMASRCSADDSALLRVCTPLVFVLFGVHICLEFFTKSQTVSVSRLLSAGVSAAPEQDWKVRNVRSKVKRGRRLKRAIRLAAAEMNGF